MGNKFRELTSIFTQILQHTTQKLRMEKEKEEKRVGASSLLFFLWHHQQCRAGGYLVKTIRDKRAYLGAHQLVCGLP